MKHVPVMEGMIERRLLVNYRVDPKVLERFLPAPFRPELVRGVGVAGICLIRLGGLRPSGLPSKFGVTTENAAHRVAVVWDEPNGPCRGVYIPRRDTSSRLTTFLGGRLFPGEHHRAVFDVREADGSYGVAFESLDGSARVSVMAKAAGELPSGSVFDSTADASGFFRTAPLGFSATHLRSRFDGLELRCDDWHVEPLTVEQVQSSFFEDEEVFPSGAVQLDSALLMRNIRATWLANGYLEGIQRTKGEWTVAA